MRESLILARAGALVCSLGVSIAGGASAQTKPAAQAMVEQKGPSASGPNEVPGTEPAPRRPRPKKRLTAGTAEAEAAVIKPPAVKAATPLQVKGAGDKAMPTSEVAPKRPKKIEGPAAPGG